MKHRIKRSRRFPKQKKLVIGICLVISQNPPLRSSEEITVTTGELPAKTTHTKWSLISDRNHAIATLSDTSPHAPLDFPHRPAPEGLRIWFPTVDIEWDPRFEAVIEFSDFEEGDTFCWNGNFYELCGPILEEVRVGTGIENWENQLFIQSDAASIQTFSIETKPVALDASQTVSTLAFTPLSPSWEGVAVAWVRQSPEASWEPFQSFPVSIKERQQSASLEVKADLPLSSLKSTIRYLLESQNRNPLSPTYGGFFLFFDKDTDSYRRSDWMWSYGPAIQLLVRAAKIEAISEEFGYNRLMEAARLASECSLRFQVDEPSHPANGLLLCRLDPRYDSPQGAEGFCSPADSLFLAGFGWVPYFEATGDARFLAASQRLYRNVDRILDLDALIEQDYLLREQRWKNWTMDESGFGMIGFSTLFHSTNDPEVARVGKRYLEGLLKALEREDGLWDRVWHRNLASHSDNGWSANLPKGTPKLIKTKFSTRGLGWAMIGLISACELFPEDEQYLEKAVALSDHLLASQLDDGHWEFLFRDPQYADEPSAKGTALWTLLFYQLYKHSGEQRHLDAARKGLAWCIQNRDLESIEGYGGLFETNRESGVIYRRWNNLSCSYTMGFFGLALLEELSLEPVR